MPALLITIKKASVDEPWIVFDDREFVKDNFTQSEIDNILMPYHKFVIGLPGYISSATAFVDDTMTVTHTFDTVEHAENANALLGLTSIEPIVMANRELVRNLRTKLGVNYTYERTVIQ